MILFRLLRYFQIYFLLSMGIVSFIGFSLPVQAEILISPYTPQQSDINTRSWFTFTANSGQTIDESILLKNTSDRDVQVALQVSDYQGTNSGVFSLQDPSIQPTALGSWVSLETGAISIPADGFVRVPFRITIPETAEDREYAAGITVQEIDTQNTPVKVVVRKGVRLYVLVGQNHTVTEEFGEFRILNPQDVEFESYADTYNFLGPDNVSVILPIKNSGNRFGLFEGVITLTKPNGERIEQEIRQELLPNNISYPYIWPLQTPYQEGITEAKLEYRIVPFQSQGLSVIQASEGVFTDSIELQSGDISSLKENQPSSESVNQIRVILISSIGLIAIALVVYAGYTFLQRRSSSSK